MPDVNVTASYSSTILAENSVTSTIAPAADTTGVLEFRDLLPALEDILQRATYPAERLAHPSDRVLRPASRFSLQELVWILDEAAIETVLQVKARYLKPLQTSKSPSGAAWSLTDVVRLLGSTVSVDGNKAKRVSFEQHKDLVSRGITFSDSYPVYVHEGAEMTVFGDTTDPDDAAATWITLPAPVAKSATVTVAGGGHGAFNAVQLTVTAGDEFVEGRDHYLPAYLNDGAGIEGWGYIYTYSSSTVITLWHDVDFTTISTPGTLTWTVPAFYQLPEILKNACLQLAAAYCFAQIGEVNRMTAALKNFKAEMDIYGLTFMEVEGVD